MVTKGVGDGYGLYQVAIPVAMACFMPLPVQSQL